ncbi:MAG TPA: hypothetical protein VGW38_20220 [Chloroflexota bacterium]|nr:hypothetical protein [Chloroflexota bacterium]
MPPDENRIPPLLPQPPFPLIAVGKHAPSSVDAEDFSRKVGNWGGASKFIGDRWEVVALAHLRRRLPWSSPLGGGHAMVVRAILEVDADPAAGAALQRAGISAPDLLLIGEASGRLALRAADCKVSLDTAEREQTAPARLQRMFARATAGQLVVEEALRAQAEHLPTGTRELAHKALEAAWQARWDDVLVTEGLFVAPDNGFNRWFIDQLETRRRTGAPLGRMPSSGPRRSGSMVDGPVDAAAAERLQLPVHTEQLTVDEFLSVLPGWTEAAVVAESDGVSLQRVDLAIAERCWRVAVGLRGAVLAMNRRLFHPPLRALDKPEVEISKTLRHVITRRRPADSAELVGVISHSVAARRPLWEREAALLRPPTSFAAWSLRLSEARGAVARSEDGARLADQAGVPARALYKDLVAQHVERVVSAARELEQQGLDDLALLDTLEGRASEWQERAASDADELAQRVTQGQAAVLDRRAHSAPE